jgi:acetyl esterase/lipase
MGVSARGAGVATGALLACLVTASAAQRAERDIPYRAGATANQRMDAYYPGGAATSKAPVVLFIHGGSLQASGERRTSAMYAPVCPGLAGRGIVCLTMDYRLAPAARWPAMPEDVAAAVRWVRDSISTRGGDPARIFLVGHSSGCLLAASVALDSIYLATQRLDPGAIAGVVAMGCTLAPWDTTGRAISSDQLARAFQADEVEVRIYGTLAWRLRCDPILWISRASPPVLVLVAESERFMPPVLEDGARFVRRMREEGRSADLRILPGRKHVTTTTGFADPADPVAAIVADFVRDPKGYTATP